MTLYELLLFLHVLAVATWFGSGVAILVIGTRALRSTAGAFPSFAVGASWWAGRAHPAAGVVLLVTGLGMVAEADIPFSEPWVLIALAGLLAAMAVGGAVIGPASAKLTSGLEGAGGTMGPELRPVADRLLLYSRAELAIVALVIADMVFKPGL